MNPEGLSMSTPDPAIEHESHDRHGAFFIQREGRRVGELTYHLAGDTAIVGHTWVDPRLRGGGEARRLVTAVVAWARHENRKISPACSYVRMVMDRRPADYADVRKS
jgi:predicted GNAT family acetyltransferase